MARPQTSQTRGGTFLLRDMLPGWVAANMRDNAGAHLLQLWKNWSMVMGPDLAQNARPLGHRGDVLLVGGDDPCAVQELTYAVPEILERVNAFMAEDRFTRVELHLMFGKTALDAPRAAPAFRTETPPRPQGLGALDLDPSSPVGRCYAAYRRCFPA